MPVSRVSLKIAGGCHTFLLRFIHMDTSKIDIFREFVIPLYFNS